jgi:selenoprotein W-related protein
LSAEIRNGLEAQVELIRSAGGVFEVKQDGRLIFSKKSLGRFPQEGEILRLLAGA